VLLVVTPAPTLLLACVRVQPVDEFSKSTVRHQIRARICKGKSDIIDTCDLVDLLIAPIKELQFLGCRCGREGGRVGRVGRVRRGVHYRAAAKVERRAT